MYVVLRTLPQIPHSSLKVTTLFRRLTENALRQYHEEQEILTFIIKNQGFDAKISISFLFR